MSSMKTNFWIFMEDAVFLSPLIPMDSSVAHLLQELKGCETFPSRLTGIRFADCKLYKFSIPLLVKGGPHEKVEEKVEEEVEGVDEEEGVIEEEEGIDEEEEEVDKEEEEEEEVDEEVDRALVNRCLEARSYWVRISSRTCIGDLAEAGCLNNAYICLVIGAPGGQHDTAISHLHGQILFKALQIRLNSLLTWTKEDVTNNLKNGVFSENGRGSRDRAIQALETELAAKRTCYDPRSDAHPDKDYSRDFTTAQQYPSQFEQYFTPICQSDQDYAVKDQREFITFFNLLRCHAQDAAKIAKVKSSSMNANHLSSHFLTPPFFACQPEDSKITFMPEFTSKFPIFLGSQRALSSWCKCTPRSDFAVYVAKFLFPLLLCKVVKTEADRWRMLIQGIAAARVLYLLRKPNVAISFFVVAICLRSNLTAERYIVMQTDPKGKVSIAQKNYDLKDPSKSQDFLKEMYNLQVKFNSMAQELDDSKKNMLKTIARIADPLTSLSRRRDKIKEERKSRNHDFTEDIDVQECLNEMGCRKVLPLLGHPNVVVIAPISDSDVHGYLKFTKIKSEVDVLRHLMNIADPENHTISGARIWSRSSGGHIIYTPLGGGHLTDLKRPDKHVWSAAKQLVEGVAFMHKHNVAHLDIKPANVLIPVDGGRLSINDFSIAMFVNGKTSRGKVGTRGYIAPEVLAENADYDPIRADLWSCGKTLEDLISCCNRSTREKDFLAAIAKQLMVDEPQARPMMSEVLAQMVSFESFSVEGHPPMK